MGGGPRGWGWGSRVVSQLTLNQKKSCAFSFSSFFFPLFLLFLSSFSLPRHYLIPCRGFGKSLYDYTLTKWDGSRIILSHQKQPKQRAHLYFDWSASRSKNTFSSFPCYIFLIWRGGRAISLMESDRILLCLMKFWLLKKNETLKLRLLLPKQQSLQFHYFGEFRFSFLDAPSHFSHVRT